MSRYFLVDGVEIPIPANRQHISLACLATAAGRSVSITWLSQAPDVGAQRGPRDTQQGGRVREVPLLGDREEVPQAWAAAVTRRD